MASARDNLAAVLADPEFPRAETKKTATQQKLAEYLASQGELSSYEPSTPERFAGWLADTFYGDDRAGQQQANKATTALRLGTVGLLDAGFQGFEIGQDIGKGNWNQAQLGLAGASVPVPPAIKHGAKAVVGEVERGVRAAVDEGARRVGVGLPREAKAIRAYQGSPHDFAAERLIRHPDGREEFIVGQPDVLPDVPPGAEVVQDYPLGRVRLDKIGTGEGAQAYGRGAYFAENENVGKEYRDTLSKGFVYQGQPVASTSALGGALSLLTNSSKRGEDLAGMIPRRVKEIRAHADHVRKHDPYMGQGENMYDRAADILESLDPKQLKRAGKMYEVEINADPEQFLDWDKPLSEQPHARDALLGLVPPAGSNRYFDDKLLAAPAKDGGQEYKADIRSFVQELGQADSAKFSKTMSEKGIPGIKYLDQGSRNAGGWHITPPDQTVSGKWMVKSSDYNSKGMHFDTEAEAKKALDEKIGSMTRNYVVFDDKLLDIKRKYGISGLIAAMGLAGAAGYSDDAQAQTPQAQGGW